MTKLFTAFIFSFLSLTSEASFRDWSQFQRNYGGIRGLQVHSVFSRAQGSQAVFIRLFQSHESIEIKTLRSSRGWVHIKPLNINTGAYFYFSQMNESEMKQFLAEMPAIPVPHSSSVRNRFEWIPNANAQSGSISYYTGFFDVAAGCMMGTGSGVYDATLGMVVGLAEGGYELITNPVGVAEKLETQWTQMKSFFSDFQKNMSALWDGIAGLPAEAKADMLCGMVAGIGTDVAFAVFTAGVGTTKLALTIKTYLSKIMILHKTLQTFTRFGTELRHVFTSDFYRRLSAGKITQRRLNSIETFGRYDQLGLATKAASCAF